MIRGRLDKFIEMFGYKPIIGMVHLPPLPGSPLYEGGGINSIIDYALEEATILEQEGVNGIEIENFMDPSYFPGTVGPELVSAMAIIAHEIKKKIHLPLGICILADPIASIAVAHAVKAEFIRATVFTEAVVDVSGLILGRPHEILRYRKFLDNSIKIFADVQIKHSAPLAPRPIQESAYDAAYFLADAVIISGKHTGFPTPVEDVKVVKEVLPDVPVLVGSGLTAENVTRLFEYADGAIVGTYFKCEGKSENRIDRERVKKLVGVVDSIRKSRA